MMLPAAVANVSLSRIPVTPEKVVILPVQSVYLGLLLMAPQRRRTSEEIPVREHAVPCGDLCFSVAIRALLMHSIPPRTNIALSLARRSGSLLRGICCLHFWRTTRMVQQVFKRQARFFLETRDVALYMATPMLYCETYSSKKECVVMKRRRHPA